MMHGFEAWATGRGCFSFRGKRAGERRGRAVAKCWATMKLTTLLAFLASAALLHAEPPPGFRALFNGKDLTGWYGLNPHSVVKLEGEKKAAALQKMREEFAKHWRVENGELVNDGEGGYATTDAEFGDIELMIEYKTVPKADSGIYLRGTPQVQIWDPTNERETKNGADKGSGCLWNNQKAGNRPLVKADRPTGEWNTFAIRMVGENVTVHLNGQLVVDNVPLENYWVRGTPIFPTGPIELQAHGNEVRFKNLFVRELPR